MQSSSSDFNASIEVLITASALIFYKMSASDPVVSGILDRFMAIEKVICSILSGVYFLFFQIFVLAGPNGNMRKSFTAVARVARVHFFFFFLCIAECCV